MDVKKIDSLSDEKKKTLIELIENNDYLVCQPKNQNIDHMGIYQELLPELLIDMSLTPENALQEGYQFDSQVIYDREAPLEAMKDIIDLVEKNGYKLGQPASKMDQMQGLYAPIKR